MPHRGIHNLWGATARILNATSVIQAPSAATERAHPQQGNNYNYNYNYHNSSMSKHLPSISMQMVFSYAKLPGGSVVEGSGSSRIGKQIYDRNSKSLSMLPFFAIISMRNGNFYAMIKQQRRYMAAITAL